MRITPAQAAVLNARERQLLETSGPYEVRQLATLIRRTRELRDKQRDLVQRQRIAATTRSRSKESATVARTVKKEQIFSRALEHYESQLQKINSECSAAMQELSLSRKRAPRKATVAGAAGTRAAGKTAAKKAAATQATARKPVAGKATRKAGAKKASVRGGKTARGGRSAEKARTGVAARTRAQAAFR